MSIQQLDGHISVEDFFKEIEEYYEKLIKEEQETNN